MTAGGLKRLQKGTIPVLFARNGYQLPVPRPSVWLSTTCTQTQGLAINYLYPDPVFGNGVRRLSDIPDSGSDSDEMETVTVEPDQDYCVAPGMGVKANVLTDENEALRQKMRELQHQFEVLQLRQRFGTQRLVGSDADVRFYTRFAFYSHFLAFF